MENGKTRQLSTMNERTFPDGIAAPKSMHTLTQLPPTKSIECRCPQREVWTQSEKMCAWQEEKCSEPTSPKFLPSCSPVYLSGLNVYAQQFHAELTRTRSRVQFQEWSSRRKDECLSCHHGITPLFSVSRRARYRFLPEQSILADGKIFRKIRFLLYFIWQYVIIALSI